MKIAILSDIHGNNFAFEAVLEDIKNKGLEGMIIAGDHFNDIPQHFAFKLAEDRGYKGSLVPNDVWLEADGSWNW